MAVGDWSTTAASNTMLGTVSVAPNTNVSNVDNAFREMMAQIKVWYDAVQSSLGTASQPLDATLTALAGLTTAANKGIYATGPDAFATFDLTAFGRTLAGLADAAALRTTLGAITVTSVTLAANGQITFDVSGTPFSIKWGSGTWATPTSFVNSFATACWVVVPVTTSLIGESDEADEILYVSSKSVSGFTTAIKGDYSSAPSLNYIAIGS